MDICTLYQAPSDHANNEAGGAGTWAIASTYRRRLLAGDREPGRDQSFSPLAFSFESFAELDEIGMNRFMLLSPMFVQSVPGPDWNSRSRRFGFISFAIVYRRKASPSRPNSS